MFTNEEKRNKNWRSAKRALRKARNKVARLEKKLKGKRFEGDKQQADLKDQLTDARVLVSTLELRVGDKPE